MVLAEGELQLALVRDAGGVGQGVGVLAEQFLQIPKLLVNGSYEKAKSCALEMRDIFGPDGFYLELQLDALPLAGPVEIDHPVHDAVVGDCHGGLAQFFDALGQAVDAAEAVEEAVLGVDVEVGK